jgi:hypothetical protein
MQLAIKKGRYAEKENLKNKFVSKKLWKHN